MTGSFDPGQALPRSFFDRPVLELAPLLLGCVLVERGVALRITEVEAYVGQHDPGSHAFRGRTARNATMFGPPGHLYVYRHMGLHVCMNIVADAEGTATGCLIRGGEVIAGKELAFERRRAAGVCRSERDLARGPGRATVACGVSWADDGLDLCRPGADGLLFGSDAEAAADAQARPLRVLGRTNAADRSSHDDADGTPQGPHPRLATGPRIGLREEASDPVRYPWRFRIAGDPTVSGPAALNR